jgi:hypothetical protein
MTITGKRLNAFGSLTCSDKPVFSPLRIPYSIPIGVPVTLSALSINCASPIGTVTVTTAAGDSLTLHDDGIAPDLAAGDGIFTGTWTPTRVGERLDFTFFSSFGTKTETVFTPPMSMDFEILNCTFGEAYSHFLKAHGGLPPYTWLLTSGTLPPGLILNTSTGELTGTASSPGVFTFTAQVTDTFKNVAAQTFSMRVIQDSLLEQWRALRDWAPAKGVNGVMGIAIDQSENVYVTGGTGLNIYEYNHIATMKYDASGNVLWEIPYISGDNDWPTDNAVDGIGNLYVAENSGYKQADGSWIWQGTVIKYDSQGNIIWTKSDFNLNGRVFGVAADKNGHVYAAGDDRIIKYDSSGNIVWTEIYGNALDQDVPGGIAIDGNENIVVTGSSLDSNSNFTHLMVKYDPSGNLIWVNRSDPGFWFPLGHGIAADQSGNIYALRSSATSFYTLIMKLDSSGSTLWTFPYYGYQGDSITVDESGNVYVTGFGYNLDSLLIYVTIKLDPSGNLLWTQSSGAGHSIPYGIAVDNEGFSM